MKQKDVESSIYDRFHEAEKNFEQLQDVFIKHSTRNKSQVKPIEVNLFQISGEQENLTSSFIHSTTLQFNNGWQYSGQILQGKFHGFGTLSFQSTDIYSGDFKFGKMDGLGKLKNHQFFSYLVQYEEWQVYEGEFHEGLVTGFGNLYLSKGQVITGIWNEGKAEESVQVKEEELCY